MKNRILSINKEVKASVVYTLCSLLSRGLAIITVPIFTRLLSTEEMGVVNLFNSWQSMIGSLATLSLTSGGYMLALKEFRNQKDEYMSSVLSLTSLVAVLITVIYFLSPTFWASFLGLSKPLCVLMLFSFLISPAIDFWLARQRYEYRYILSSILTIIPAILASVVSIISVLVCSRNGMQALGEIRLFANYSVILGVGLIIWVHIIAKGRTLFNKKYWLFSLQLSIPLIGNSIAMQILSVSDRTMISKMVGNDAVGIYGVLYTVSSLSLIVWNAINTSFVPYLFENIDNEHKANEIKRTTSKLLLVYGMVTIFLTLIGPEIVGVLATEKYYEAIYIMPPIAAGIFLTAVSNMYTNILIYYKKTQYIMISSGIAAVLNLCLNYMCIRRWGYLVAAYTTLFAYIVLAILQSIISSNICKKYRNGLESKVHDNSLILLISSFIILLCLSCLVLYTNNYIRYIVIVFAFAICIVKRKRIIMLVKRK